MGLLFSFGNKQRPQERAWNATICDVQRTPLDSKVLYHIPCGSFMNLASVQKLLGVHADTLNPQIITNIAGVCHGCFRY